MSDTFKHGAGGYSNHGCRCGICRDAWRIKKADYRRRKREGATMLRRGPVPDPAKQHGYSAYVNYGCRCGVCRAAAAAYRRQAAMKAAAR